MLLRLTDVERSVILQSMFAIGSIHLLAVFPGICHSSTRPGTYITAHMTQFYQAFLCTSTAVTNAGVRRPGYKASVRPCRPVH